MKLCFVSVLSISDVSGGLDNESHRPHVRDSPLEHLRGVTEQTRTQRRNVEAVPFMWAYPLADWLRGSGTCHVSARRESSTIGWAAAAGNALIGRRCGIPTCCWRVRIELAVYKRLFQFCIKRPACPPACLHRFSPISAEKRESYKGYTGTRKNSAIATTCRIIRELGDLLATVLNGASFLLDKVEVKALDFLQHSCCIYRLPSTAGCIGSTMAIAFSLQSRNERVGKNGRSPRKPVDQRHRMARFPPEKFRSEPAGSERGSPWWEVSGLTAQPPWPRNRGSSSASQKQSLTKVSYTRVRNKTRFLMGEFGIGKIPAARCVASLKTKAAQPFSKTPYVRRARWCSGQTSLTAFNSWRGHRRIFERGNCTARCRWSAGFLEDLPFTPSLHSDAAHTHLVSPSSAVKTAMLRALLLAHASCVRIQDSSLILDDVTCSVICDAETTLHTSHSKTMNPCPLQDVNHYTYDHEPLAASMSYHLGKHLPFPFTLPPFHCPSPLPTPFSRVSQLAGLVKTITSQLSDPREQRGKRCWEAQKGRGEWPPASRNDRVGGDVITGGGRILNPDTSVSDPYFWIRLRVRELKSQMCDAEMKTGQLWPRLCLVFDRGRSSTKCLEYRECVVERFGPLFTPRYWEPTMMKRGRTKREIPLKRAEQWHRPARLPHVKTQERRRFA
ncbi:hypothetical protein PR048_008289 [Dryococelus australis]|uniref:Uncharacterized protein n=1 Tax=Dryococelus australis TaxID=614101 RepID=A0ABQ9HWP2_9NEOP|nr:hypothetical protein PR048_008289 [Dryococelus australis]